MKPAPNGYLQNSGSRTLMERLKTLLTIASLWLLLGGLAQAGTVHYYYTDPQGTPLVKTDASGNVIARYDYAPYGATVASLGTAPNGPGYTGHVNDPETGLVYMQARYYDPALGRFLSIDPVTPSAGNGFSFNRYAYADNNPVVRTDPDGRQTDPAPAAPDVQYKNGVPAASGQLQSMLTCVQQCAGQRVTVTSTHEDVPQHGADTPHGRGEAADLRVAPGTEREVLQCAANCGARFGQNEVAHPSAHATGPHVHIQTGPGVHGGRGDLPQPQQQQQPAPQPAPQQPPQAPPIPPTPPTHPQEN